MKALTLLHDDPTSRDIAALTSKAWTDERHLYKDKAALLQIIDQSKGEYDLIIIKGHGDIVDRGTDIGTPRRALNLALNEIDEIVTRLSGHRIVTPTLILDGCYSISVASRFLPVMTKSPSTGKEPVIVSYYGMSDGILASQYIEALNSGAAKPLATAIAGVRSSLEAIQPPDPVATAKYPTPKDTSGNPIVPYVFLPIVLCGPTKFQSGPRPAYTALDCSTIKYRILLDGAPPPRWLDLRDAKGISRDSEEYSVAALDALLKYVRDQPGVTLGDRNYGDFVRVAERL